MALRRTLFVVGAATLASFAAGWVTGVAKSKGPSVPVVAASTAEPHRPVATPELFPGRPPPEDPTFKQKILPFINNYCMPCHSMDKASGGLVLEGYTTELQARKARKDWQAVQH